MQEISQYQESTVGSYRLFRLVGVGPLSHAHLAGRQDQPERRLVVKLFDMVPLHSVEEQDQALEQIRLLSFLEHPSILPMLDDGLQGETLYLVSPYIEAGSLRQRLTAAGSELLPLKEVMALLRQVGEALHFAHTQQAVHANLKPENILVQSDGKVLLADFRLPSLARSERAVRMLSTFAAFYMAPEQFRGEATPASDQYALACLAYELLTGRPPFEADDFKSLVRKHATQKPQSPAALQPKRAQHVEHVLLKALAKRPAERYPDIQAFLAELSAPPPLVTAASAITPASEPAQPREQPDAAVPAKPVAPDVTEESTVLLPAVVPGTLTGPEKQDNREDQKLAPLGPSRSRPPFRFSSRRIWVVVGLVCLAIVVSFTSLFLFLAPSSSNRTQVHTGGQTATSGSLSSPDPISATASAGVPSTPTVVGITLHATPTPVPRPSPVPVRTPTSGSSPAPTATPTPKPTPVPALSCAVNYHVSAQWPGAFIGNLTITNTGATTIQGWALVFSFSAGQWVWGGWNGHFQQSGAQVTVTNTSDNGTLAPGSSVTPGFQGAWNGSNPAPGAFTLNGVTCH